ncbi:hypothetical protein DMUE_4781 [Dictyocoela muelleri]|nr:hypothetical protein DMUE_4781 [Dictyocoela muelleri]
MIVHFMIKFSIVTTSHISDKLHVNDDENPNLPLKNPENTYRLSNENPQTTFCKEHDEFNGLSPNFSDDSKNEINYKNKFHASEIRKDQSSTSVNNNPTSNEDVKDPQYLLGESEKEFLHDNKSLNSDNKLSEKVVSFKNNEVRSLEEFETKITDEKKNNNNEKIKTVNNDKNNPLDNEQEPFDYTLIDINDNFRSKLFDSLKNDFGEFLFDQETAFLDIEIDQMKQKDYSLEKDLEEIYQLLKKDRNLLKSEDLEIPCKKMCIENENLNLKNHDTSNEIGNEVVFDLTELFSEQEVVQTNIISKYNSESITSGTYKTINPVVNDSRSIEPSNESKKSEIVQNLITTENHNIICPINTSVISNSQIESCNNQIVRPPIYILYSTNFSRSNNTGLNIFVTENNALGSALNSNIVHSQNNFNRNRENLFREDETFMKDNLDNRKYWNFIKFNEIFRTKLKQIFNQNCRFDVFFNAFINQNHHNIDIKNFKTNIDNPFRPNLFNFSLLSLKEEIEGKYPKLTLTILHENYEKFLKSLGGDIYSKIRDFEKYKFLYKQVIFQKWENILIMINESVNFITNPISEFDKLIIFYVSKNISEFLKNIFDNIFSELEIIDTLFNLNMHKQRVLGRKWHSGIFLVMIVKNEIQVFKNKCTRIEYYVNSEEYFKDILRIRIFNILPFLKFLDIRKPYLLGYCILSLKSYLLKTKRICYNEKNEFDDLFRMSLHELIQILSKQNFNNNQLLFENFELQ